MSEAVRLKVIREILWCMKDTMLALHGVNSMPCDDSFESKLYYEANDMCCKIYRRLEVLENEKEQGTTPSGADSGKPAAD